VCGWCSENTGYPVFVSGTESGRAEIVRLRNLFVSDFSGSSPATNSSITTNKKRKEKGNGGPKQRTPFSKRSKVNSWSGFVAARNEAQLRATHTLITPTSAPQ